MIRFFPALLAVTCLLPMSAFSESVTLRSTASVPMLIELFTSQGCSSCPPAEKWLSRYADSPDLWTKVIPLAFHVEYWDRLGWRDPFASSEHADRQRNYHRSGRVASVYTPGFVVNGREWRGWFRGNDLPTSQSTSITSITAKYDGDTVQVSVSGETEGLAAHIAMLGMSLETDVQRGENRGMLLKEDFVVMQYEKRELQESASTFNVDEDVQAYPGKLGHAVWITDSSDAIIQAVGGWLR